jgi:hypothetical protein
VLPVGAAGENGISFFLLLTRGGRGAERRDWEQTKQPKTRGAAQGISRAIPFSLTWLLASADKHLVSFVVCRRSAIRGTDFANPGSSRPPLPHLSPGVAGRSPGTSFACVGFIYFSTSPQLFLSL